MTKLCVVAVKDSAIQAFGRPIYVPHIGAAIRSFSDEVNRNAPDNQLYAHPDDFELVYLADFDDESGRYEAVDVRVLSRGKDVKQS